jgi:hypothetical protein
MTDPITPASGKPRRRLLRNAVFAFVLVGAISGLGVAWWLRCPGEGWPSYDPLASLPVWSIDSDESSRLVVFGDTQPTLGPEGLQWHEKAAVMRDRILSLDPLVVLHIGDLVDAFGARQDGHSDRLPLMWSGFLDFYRPLLERAPLLPAYGNHDVGCDGFERVFRLPDDAGTERFWTLVLGPVRIIALDSNAMEEIVPGGRQARWFDQVMAVSETPQTLVMFHHPPFTIGPSDARDRLPIHDLLRPHASRLTAAFCGHDHLYYRTRRDGIPYFVTGGGGYYLSHPRAEKVAHILPDDRYGRFHHVLAVDLAPDRTTVRCIQEDGSVFDEVEVWPRDR